MALEQSTRICSVQRRAALRAFLSLCILLPLFAQASQAQNASIASDQSGKAQVFSATPNGTTSETDEINYGQVMRDVLSAALSKVPRSLVKKLLAADVRPECSVALLRTMRAFQNFEPWAMRLFDATGKYPTGALEATRADMGAFDECLETAVRDRDGNVLSRGQYCNLIVHVLNATAIQELVRSYEDFLPPKVFYFSKYGNPPEIPLARMAVCYIDECNQNDLQAMVDAVSIPFVSVEVSNCVTAEPRPWDKAQIAIVILAGILFVAIVLSTAVDYFVDEQSKWRKKHGILFQVAMAFSAISNTRMLSNVARKDQADQYSLQFLHGVRFFTITHVLLGHINAVITDSLSRLLSLFEDTARWENMMVVAAFNGVDTFFFLSGFLMGYIINKQEGNRVVVFIIALIRRSIRMCVPFFFVFMWFYLLPRFVDGPDTKSFFQRFYADMSAHWWHFLLQIRNLYELEITDILGHTWYLSADSQLFVVGLLTLLIFRRRKSVALTVLAMLSLLGCAIGTWTMARSRLLPFLVIPFPQYRRMQSTINEYYVKPFYHAVCYFGGCMTSLIIPDFGGRKVSKTLQLAGWCVSATCGLFCVFIKFPWYTMENPTSETVEIIVAFFDRILWTISLAWITLACSTGRGGPVSKFLSWNAFVPLSKLSYGVYLIHVPFLELMALSSRERIHFSQFNRAMLFFAVIVWCYLLSYLAFIACEAPTGVLDKLLFKKFVRGDSGRKQERPDEIQVNELKTMRINGESHGTSL